MKLLNELNKILNLSDAQKTVLVITNFSATPKQAYTATVGSEKLVYARDSLVKMGFINMMAGEITLTEVGKNAIIEYNLSSTAGEPTNDALALLKLVASGDTIIEP